MDNPVISVPPALVVRSNVLDQIALEVEVSRTEWSRALEHLPSLLVDGSMHSQHVPLFELPLALLTDHRRCWCLWMFCCFVQDQVRPALKRHIALRTSVTAVLSHVSFQEHFVLERF